MHGPQSVTAEAGPAAGSTTREPPGTGFNVQLKSIPLNGHIVLLPPSDDDRGAVEADDRPPAHAPEPNRGTPRRR